MMVAGLIALCGVAQAEVIFSDKFSVDGSLNGSSADIGGTWNVTSGNLSISGGVVDTASSYFSDSDIAFASFTRALTANETLTLTFQTTTSSGSFSTTGWAGLSLFEKGDEKLFLGGPSYTPAWGIVGNAIGGVLKVFSPSITNAAQTAVFNYVFNTGDWNFTVNSQQISGTATANLAFDQIRIGADIYNYKDIAVSEINVTSAIPEPATFLLFGLGGMGAWMLRRHKAKSNVELDD